MSVLLAGFLANDQISWKPGHIYDLQDAWILQFFVPTRKIFHDSTEALDFAAAALQPCVLWRTFGPRGHWAVDFDKLRQAAPQLRLPDWLLGCSSTLASVRPGFSQPPDPSVSNGFNALEITCQFFQIAPPPTLEAMVEAANRPIEIQDSLSRFRQQFAAPERVGFVMMRFDGTRLHREIYEAIQETLAGESFTAVRADDRAFHDNLLENVLTYIHGCRFGIAVFERLAADEFNPNKSLEVWYMMALHKPVCLLKDQTLRALHADLMGRIYRVFDPQSPKRSIPAALQSWMAERHLLSG
jgi:hypothetical protein